MVKKWIAIAVAVAAGLSAMKLAGVISGPWWLVLLPLWLPAAGAAVFVAVVFALFAIADLVNRQ